MGACIFAFIVVVCVLLAVLVHGGVLDKTTALMVAARSSRCCGTR